MKEDLKEDLKTRHHIDDIIMAGDFNVTLNPGDTTSNSSKPRAEGRLRSLILDLDIIDVDPVLNLRPKHTYFCIYREKISSRLDRFYVSPQLLADAKIIRKDRVDDHTPLVLEIQEQRSHTNIWRFEDKLLEDASFKQKLQNTMRESLLRFSEEDLSEVQINNIQNCLRGQEPFKI